MRDKISKFKKVSELRPGDIVCEGSGFYKRGRTVKAIEPISATRQRYVTRITWQGGEPATVYTFDKLVRITPQQEKVES